MPCLALSICAVASGCTGETNDDGDVGSTSQAVVSPNTDTFPSTYARQWMTNLSNSVKGDRIHPVVAARTYSYGAIAIYEALVNGMPGYRSLGGQVNGLGQMPTPDANKVYDWPTVLAQTMRRVSMETYVFPLRLFFEYTTNTEASLDELGPAQIGHRLVAGVTPQVSADSIAFGNQLADKLVAWINSDGYSVARFKGWVPPVGPDKWVPTGFSDTDKVANPEEPWFGQLVRPIVLTSPDECKPPPPPPFSTDPSSQWYIEAKEVYDTERNATDEGREIAAFWADVPGASATPPGHWVALATKMVRSRNLNLAQAAYGYAQGIISVHDAAIAVWNEKYRSNTLRPETYIRRHIDPGWQATWPAPRFPAYTSGHSGFSGAASRTLKEAFGDGPIVDDTKVRRGYAARTFANWDAAANEAADSRLYGGIHFRMDNVQGLNSGHCVADKVLERVHFRL
ncbi:MAG: vanadium-dependent haloperoxidase [Labilithrix sp.]